jgi:uncharacterized protein YecE (DUF72 family)
MWAHRGWVGRWFPASVRAGEELAAYASWCDAVEGNTTFYATPDAAAVQRWAELAPDSFRFLFKVPRTVSHERRLRGAEAMAETEALLERLAPLGPRTGPVQVQLPASFGPDDLRALDAYLAGRPSAPEAWAVEVRHPAFFDGAATERRLNDLLFAHGVDRVVLDSRALFATAAVTEAERETQARKPRLPVRAVALGHHPVVRFIGGSDPAANPPFWAPWVRTAARWLEDGREPIVFIHTPDNLAAPWLARRFHAEVAALLPDLDPLPEPLAAPRQDALW